jgi:predicted amidohydrolase
VLRVLSPVNAVVVFGFIEKDDEGFYNSAIAVERGKIAARYRKTHLLNGERGVFLPGDGSPLFAVDGTMVAMNICYDLNFSASVERAAKSGARVLVCPCSNMMPRELAEEWKTRHNEIRTRHARTYGVWIVSADITGERDGSVSYGPTAIIDPLGVVVAEVAVMDAGMVLSEIH